MYDFIDLCFFITYGFLFMLTLYFNTFHFHLNEHELI